jgi:hypothetical protein
MGEWRTANVNIQQAFNAAAADYDRLRRILIPCFEDFYRTAVEIIPFDRRATLEAQLGWLEAAGFQDVDCCYKNFSFAVFGGFSSHQSTAQSL